MNRKTKKEKSAFELAIAELNSAINGHRKGAKIPQLIRKCFETSKDNEEFTSSFSELVNRQFKNTKGTDPTRSALRMALKRERDNKGYSRDNGKTAYDVSVEFSKTGANIAVTQHKTNEEQNLEETETETNALPIAGAERADVVELESKLNKLSAEELLQLGRDLIGQVDRLEPAAAHEVCKSLQVSLSAAKRRSKNRAAELPKTA